MTEEKPKTHAVRQALTDVARALEDAARALENDGKLNCSWIIQDGVALILELEAQLADTDALRRQIETIATQIVERHDRVAELEAENERLKREADGPFARALKDVMSAYPGFEWHDYPDGITADDIREFFRADLDETWRIFDASKARVAGLEAERDEARKDRDAWISEVSELRLVIQNLREKYASDSDRIAEFIATRAKKFEELEAEVAKERARSHDFENENRRLRTSLSYLRTALSFALGEG